MKECLAYIGQGIGFFLLCAGIGGCYYVCQKSNDGQPLIQITNIIQTNTPAK